MVNISTVVVTFRAKHYAGLLWAQHQMSIIKIYEIILFKVYAEFPIRESSRYSDTEHRVRVKMVLCISHFSFPHVF